MIRRFGARQLVCGLAMMMFVLACSGSDEESGDKESQSSRGRRPGMNSVARTGASIPVEVKTVGRGNIAATLLTYTSLEAERHVDVVSRTQGLVKTIFVEEGDRVEEGQPLAQLDTAVLELTLKEREVNMSSLGSNYERAQELRGKEFLSSQEFEQTKFQYEAAQTQYESAKLQLAYATIRSPFAGIITDRLVDVGNLVNANDGIFRTADLDPLLARIFVPEKDIRHVQPGQTVRINVEGSNQTYTGKVARISPIVDPQSGTVKVTVEIKDRKSNLRPGMFTTVNLVISIHENVLQVEKKALVAEAEGSYVFLFEEGTAEKRLLDIGISEGDYVEVLAGLSEGDSIITVGQEGLRNGAPVRIAGQPAQDTADVGGMAGDSGNINGVSKEGTVQRSETLKEKGEVRSRGFNEEAGADRNGGRSDRMMSMDLDEMKKRMFRNSKIKTAYEKKLEEDPSFASDENRQRVYLINISRQMRTENGSRPR